MLQTPLRTGLAAVCLLSLGACGSTKPAPDAASTPPVASSAPAPSLTSSPTPPPASVLPSVPSTVVPSVAVPTAPSVSGKPLSEDEARAIKKDLGESPAEHGVSSDELDPGAL